MHCEVYIYMCVYLYIVTSHVYSMDHPASEVLFKKQVEYAETEKPEEEETTKIDPEGRVLGKLKDERQDGLVPKIA